MRQSLVIVQLRGGLGNQMFQYACGRALALRRNGEPVLDWRDFRAGPGQAPGLAHFNIVSRPSRDSQLPPTRSRHLRHALWRVLKQEPRLVREHSPAFNAAVPGLSGPVCLRGYWQSERYFVDAAVQIRRDLQIRTAPNLQNAALLNHIAARPAVSLHIRRGDYVDNPKANAVHGTLTLDYYRRAADHIAENTAQQPVFFVFSDDPGWALANLQLPFEFHVVAHNDSAHNYEDLRLMSACRHHIIANSSFSWWGAWLNPSPGKIVVAPARWFADPRRQNPDILPPGWIAVAP